MSRIVGGTAILDGSVSGQFDLDQIRETIKNLSLGVFVRTFRRHQLLQEIHHISSCHMHLVGVLSGKYTLVWLWRSLTGYVSEYSQGFRGKTAQHVLGTYVGPDMIIWYPLQSICYYRIHGKCSTGGFILVMYTVHTFTCSLQVVCV